jgi:hypothetical protein
MGQPKFGSAVEVWALCCVRKRSTTETFVCQPQRRWMPRTLDCFYAFHSHTRDGAICGNYQL